MERAEFGQLVASTWRIRHHPAWAAARQALSQAGINPDRAICTYFGGWGDSGCEFALPDRCLLLLCVLLGWDGRFFVPTDRIEEQYPPEPSQKLALALASSGDTEAFDAAVLSRFQQDAAQAGGVGEPEATR